MKKILNLILTLVIMAAVPSVALAINEDGTYTAKEMKEFRKQAEKMAKNKAKEFKKQGWNINGSGDLAMMLNKHYLKTENFGGKGIELQGNSNGIKNLSTAIMSARLAATREYAAQVGTALKEKIEGSNTIVGNIDSQNLIAGFEARVAQELKGEINPSIVMYKKNKDGSYEVMSFFVVDPDATKALKIRTLKAEAEYMQLSTEIANTISKFVNE